MGSTRSAFARLSDLLCGAGVPPGMDPIPLHLGESRLGEPAIDVGPLTDIDGWTRYPRLGGTENLRAAYSEWLGRRFGVRKGLADSRIAVEPTPGTKQAVSVVIGLAAARKAGVGDPAIVLPNPFYPTYHAGTEAVGARPVFYNPGCGDAAAELAQVVHSLRDHVAAIIVCNPGSPRGEVLSAETLRAVGGIAAEAGALLVVDECYIDLSFGCVPTGYLSLVDEQVMAPGPFLVLHSLSKRSGAPGLRSGFVAGDPSTVAAYASYNRACGVSTPHPVCAVASALWVDEDHVSRVRSALSRNWDLADAILGGIPRYRRAQAGFFLWLPVADDEATALRLWLDQALSVMPGRYLAAEDASGVNPGIGHVRIALVHEDTIMREALTRLRAAMTWNQEMIA